MADCLKIIPSRLLIPDVSVDTRITSRACQVLSLSEGDVLTLGVLEALGQPKIDYIDAVLIMLLTSNQEVVRLDVSMDYSLLVDSLDTHYL
jgi:hypothetical protein